MPAKKPTIEAQLLLDPRLKNTKALDKQLKSFQRNLEKLTAEASTHTDTGRKRRTPIKEGPLVEDYEAKAALASVLQARRQLRTRFAGTEKVLEGQKKFEQYAEVNQRRIVKDTASLGSSIKNARNSIDKFEQSFKAKGKEFSGDQIDAFNKQLNSLRAAVDPLEGSYKKLKDNVSAVSVERNKEAKAARSDRLQEQRSKRATDLARARTAQQRREREVQSLTGKKVDQLGPADIAGLSRTQKTAVSSALTGRVRLAELRQKTADAFGTTLANAERANAAVQKGAVGLEAYRSISNNLAKDQESSAKSRERIAEREKNDRIQAKIDARDRAAQVKKDLEITKGLAQGRAKEREENKTQFQKDSIQNKKEQALIAEREKADLQQSRDAEKSRRADVERDRKAQETITKNQIKENDKRIADQEKKKADAVKRSIRNEEKRIAAQSKRFQFRQIQAVGKDILRSGYGASSFRDLDFGSVKKQDISGLQQYAKAQKQVAVNAVEMAKRQGASQQVMAAATARVDEQDRVLTRLHRRMRELNSPLQQVNLLFRQFFRFAIGYGVLYEALGAIKALVNGVVELDDALKSIQAITASTDHQMKGLEVTIKRVATTTKFTTTEIAAATRVLGQAGVSAEELPGALQATADFAAATASSLEVAADLITTTRNVFKDLDDNTLANQLTKAINISKLTAADLKTILSLSAQTAKSYNLTSEQYLAAVTTLRNAGIKASTVATGLRQGLIEIFSPDASSVKALKNRYDQLGEELTEEAVKQRFFGFKQSENPLLAVLSELKRIGFADDAQKEFARAFDVRAANAIKALIRNYDQLAAAEAKITFGLSAAEAAETQMESLRNSLSNLGAAFTVFGDAVGGDAVRGLEGFVDSATDALNSLTELDIALKKQGKQGLSTALIPALVGGVAGASLGSTVKGRFGLGALGAISGGAATLSNAGGEGGALTSASGVGGAAISTILLGALGISTLADLSADRGGKQQDLFGNTDGPFRNYLKGNSSKPLSKFAGKSGGKVIASLISWIGPLGKFAFLLYTFYELFSAIFGGPGGSALDQSNNRLEGTIADLSKAEAEQAQAQAIIDEFDVDAARTGKNAGTTASTLATLQDRFVDYRAAISSVFGRLTEAQLEDVEGVLSNFAKSNLAGRKTKIKELRDITGIEGTTADLDRVIFDLSSNAIAINSSVESLLDQVNTDIINVFDRIKEASEKGVDANENDIRTADLFQRSGDLREAVLGLSDATEEQILDLIVLYSQARADITATATKETNDKVAELKKSAITEQITNAVVSGEIDGLDVEVKLKEYIDSLIDLEGASKEVIEGYKTLIQGAIEDAYQQLQKTQQRDLNRAIAVATPIGFLPTPGEFEIEEPDTSEGDEVKKRLGEYILRRGAEVRAAAAKAVENTVDSAISNVRNFEELLDNPAGRKAVETSIEGTSNKEAKERLQGILDGTENVENLVEEIKSYGIDPTKLDAGKIGGGLGKLLQIIVGAAEKGNTAVQGADEVAKITPYLPSAESLAELKRLDREIRLLQGKNKENIDRLLGSGVDNPIIQRRNIKIGEARKQEQTITNDIFDEDPTGEKRQIDPDTARKIRDLEVRREKVRGEIIDLDFQAVQEMEKVREKIASRILKSRKEGAVLQKKVAEDDIGIAAGSGSNDLFRDSIDKIDAANAELLRVFEEELIRDGIQTTAPKLFEAELEERAKLLRPLRNNFEEFSKYIAEFTSEFRAQAERLRNTPVSVGGASQDAISASFGNVGNKRRSQRAALDIGAVRLDAAALGTERAELRTNLETQTGGDKVKTENRLVELNNQLIELDQSAAALNLTMMENSESAEVRAAAELAQLGNTQALIEAFQDSDHAFSNFAENLQNSITGLVSSIGDTLTDFIIDGGNFADMLGNVLHDFGRELLNQGIQTILNEMSVSLLSALPAQLVGLVPGAAGGIASEAANAVGSTVAEKGAGIVGAATEGAAAAAAVGTAVTAALAPVSLGMQVANTNLFAAGTTLNAAGIALNTAATRLVLSAIPGIKTGGVFGSSGIVRGFASGGMISGPGTGTSDSISGVHVNGSKPMPIRVSNGESILNAKATSLLGEDFIHAMNSGKIGSFNTGAVAERGNITASGMKTPVASPQESPTVNNQNDVNIINAIDSSSVVSAGLETPAGGRAIFNFLKANKSKVQRIIQ